MAASPPGAGPGGTSYNRGSAEFERVLALSDGVFAIAMTLLVISIAPPTLRAAGSESELLHALGDLWPQVAGFLIGFAVIGRYWSAHHQFFSLVDVIDRRLLHLNLVYLASIAFLPFPTALLGDFLSNPVAAGLYAVFVAVVSGLEVVLLWCAHRDGLLRRPLPGHVYRWGVKASLAPVGLFLATVPLAFASTTAAVVVWTLVVPVESLVVDRRRPPDALQYFE
jgi:uncharacterized membrane protein